MYLKNRLYATGKEVTNMAKEAAAATKIRAQIAIEENRLKNLYSEFGKACYNNPEDESIEGYRDSIAAEKEVILSYRREEAAARGLKTCRECGAVMNKDALYCSRCGARNETEQSETRQDAGSDEDEPIMKHCPVCDAVVTDDMSFCEICGAKLED